MIDVEDQKETIHIYVVREDDTYSPIIPLVLSVIALLLLIVVGIAFPYQQPETWTTIRVPAVPLPTERLSTEVKVIPTGVKFYPATRATGILTITNGSILSEELPKSMLFVGRDGAEIVTDQTVYVPAGTATSLGIAYVSARAVIPGATGNIHSLDIDTVEGAALFIRNTQPFHGGKDAYSVEYITKHDRQIAIDYAHQTLTLGVSGLLLASSCYEKITGIETIQVNWTCNPVTFETPHFQKIRILRARVSGSFIILEIIYTPYIHRFAVK
jgi:hypothetical protein